MQLEFSNRILICGVAVAGMPYPQNLATAKEVEAVVREAGAVPATIAILDGVAHIGRLPYTGGMFGLGHTLLTGCLVGGAAVIDSLDAGFQHRFRTGWLGLWFFM